MVMQTTTRQRHRLLLAAADGEREKLRKWLTMESPWPSWDVIEAVQRIAEQRAIPMAQVALAWLSARPAVTSVILGARTLEQLDANLGAAEVRLSAEETATLDAASDLHATDYPYGEMGVEQRGRKLAGGR